MNQTNLYIKKKVCYYKKGIWNQLQNFLSKTTQILFGFNWRGPRKVNPKEMGIPAIEVAESHGRGGLNVPVNIDNSHKVSRIQEK